MRVKLEESSEYTGNGIMRREIIEMFSTSQSDPLISSKLINNHQNLFII